MSAITLGFIVNPKPAIAQNVPDHMIETITGIGQQVVSQIEQSPCELREFFILNARESFNGKSKCF
jgi:hypothetical protein